MTTESDRPDSERIQVNVTFKDVTLEELKDQFPSALDDSERVRRAVADALEIGRAKQFSISRV